MDKNLSKPKVSSVQQKFAEVFYQVDEERFRQQVGNFQAQLNSNKLKKSHGNPRE